MMAGSGADSACWNVRTGISMFSIYEGCINTDIQNETFLLISFYEN